MPKQKKSPVSRMPLYQSQDCIRLNGADGVSSTEPGRSAFRKDYARLLHAPAFRRLQGKTQLFPGAESDFFRNRLTHSLEVAQIAAGIAETINANEEEFNTNNIDTDLVQFAALAHDLGHPPFGHNGEKALDELMKGYGGFEGNAQTLRILTTSEKKLVCDGNGGFTSEYGLNLTYRTLAAVLKYDSKIDVRRAKESALQKGYYATESAIVANIKRHVAPKYKGSTFKTIECSIMDLADDIAYSTYDLEDSLHARFVTPISLLRALYEQDSVRDAVFRKTNTALKYASHKPLKDTRELLVFASNIFEFPSLSTLIPEVLSNPGNSLTTESFAVRLLGLDQKLATDALIRTQYTAARVGTLINSVEIGYNPAFPSLSSVRLSRNALLNVEILKHLNYELVIRSPRLAVIEYRGKDIVKQLFDAMIDSNGDLLPEEWKNSYQSSAKKAERYRVVCEFIAGMTDRYAVEFHDALFGDGKSLYKP